MFFGFMVWQVLCDRAFPFTTTHGKEVKVFQAGGETQNRENMERINSIAN
jgi:hypothetical protein